jgi:hypothetical protein
VSGFFFPLPSGSGADKQDRKIHKRLLQAYNQLPQVDQQVPSALDLAGFRKENKYP